MFVSINDVFRNKKQLGTANCFAFVLFDNIDSYDNVVA